MHCISFQFILKIVWTQFYSVESKVKLSLKPDFGNLQILQISFLNQYSAEYLNSRDIFDLFLALTNFSIDPARFDIASCHLLYTKLMVEKLNLSIIIRSATQKIIASFTNFLHSAFRPRAVRSSVMIKPCSLIKNIMKNL